MPPFSAIISAKIHQYHNVTPITAGNTDNFILIYEEYQTYVGVEDDTLGCQVAEVAWGLWCVSCAVALWLVSPPYHSHL